MKYRRCNIITEYVCSKNGKRIISNGTKIIYVKFYTFHASSILFECDSVTSLNSLWSRGHGSRAAPRQ